MSEFEDFLKLHGDQLRNSNIPDLYWLTIYQKLKNQIFDAGNSFMMGQLDDGEWTVVMNKDQEMDISDPCHIYLIDHAWTFELKEAPLQLKSVPGLFSRISSLIGLECEFATDSAIEEVCDSMWKYLRPYSKVVDPQEPSVTFWYVLDEFGSAIKHSSLPNFRAVPFLYQFEDAAYTLLFPIKNISPNDEVLIDYVEGVGHADEKIRSAFLVPWTNQSFEDEPEVVTEPDESYFLTGAHGESLPDKWLDMPSLPKILKVYAEYSYIKEYLTDSEFVFVDNEEEADILWLTRHFHNYRELVETRSGTFINQFPCERVITTKDLLSIVGRRATDKPKWLPMTYNLMTEVPTFVGVFQRRNAAGEDNHWICKPWNLARAIDTTVSNNLDCILRLPFSGPKIAQKYANKPVLFHREEVGLVKFDVRYVVLLSSVEPLKLFVYKKFFLRFANKAFDLSTLWDYEKHFTVMNYRGTSQLHRILCDDFIPMFEKQYPNFTWEEVEKSLLLALKEVFVAASSVAPPRGLAPCRQSRALYAADLILTWDENKIQPQILEINFGPDCERACLYYNDFYNDVFKLLFKDVVDPDKFHIL